MKKNVNSKNARSRSSVQRSVSNIEKDSVGYFGAAIGLGALVGLALLARRSKH
jgi:hypothetical protein